MLASRTLRCSVAKNRYPNPLLDAPRSHARGQHCGQIRLQRARNRIGEDSKQIRLTSALSEAEARYSPLSYVRRIVEDLELVAPVLLGLCRVHSMDSFHRLVGTKSDPIVGDKGAHFRLPPPRDS